MRMPYHSRSDSVRDDKDVVDMTDPWSSLRDDPPRKDRFDDALAPNEKLELRSPLPPEAFKSGVDEIERLGEDPWECESLLDRWPGVVVEDEVAVTLVPLWLASSWEWRHFRNRTQFLLGYCKATIATIDSWHRAL